MTKGCKQFSHIMNMYKKEDVNTGLLSTIPEDFIDRFCSNINMNDEMKNLCMYITKKVNENSLVSQNTPPSIAAGCIYMVSHICKIGITKKEISQACGISEVTISKCYKKLTEYKKYLFSKELRKQYKI